MAAPTDDSPQKPGGFSLVVDDSGARLRSLPSVYVNNAQVYGHRDLDTVVKRLEEAVRVFMRSGKEATYMLTACEIEGRKGLYGTDFYNRSLYRTRLRRLGARFSDHPWVFFRGGNTFESVDFPPFLPEFVTLGWRSDTPEGVTNTKGALLVHALAYYRIADIGAAELADLAAVAARVEALGAADPAELYAAIAGLSR